MDKTLLKLVFDDVTLVGVLLAFLGLAVAFKEAHAPVLVAWSVWSGILVALWGSIARELRHRSRAR